MLRKHLCTSTHWSLGPPREIMHGGTRLLWGPVHRLRLLLKISSLIKCDVPAKHTPLIGRSRAMCVSASYGNSVPVNRFILMLCLNKRFEDTKRWLEAVNQRRTDDSMFKWQKLVDTTYKSKTEQQELHENKGELRCSRVYIYMIQIIISLSMYKLFICRH